MKRRIRFESGGLRIRSSSRRAPSIDPRSVAEALGATPVVQVNPRIPPSALAGLRLRLFSTLKSAGGRPGIEGAELRQRIPMTRDDWQRLGEIAAAMSVEGARATAGQVAAQLLHEAIEAFDATNVMVAPSEEQGARLDVSEPVAPKYVPAGARQIAESARKAHDEHLRKAQAEMGKAA